MNTTGSWTNPEKIFRHQPVAAAVSPEAFWAQVEVQIKARPAARSTFVQSVVKGEASLKTVRDFAHDLRSVARDLPLIQGEIASRAALHGVDTVIMLSQGATRAFGYQGQPALRDQVARFAKAIGTERAPDEEACLQTTSYLVCTRSLGLEWFEAGLATMLVDDDWTEAAPALAQGLERHYGVSRADLGCFDLLRDFTGTRRTELPALLREITTSGYHQRIVLHAVREVVTVWTYFWDAWAPGATQVRFPLDEEKSR